MSSSDMKRQAASFLIPVPCSQKLILKILFCENTPNSQSKPENARQSGGKFPRCAETSIIFKAVNNFHSFGAWNDFTDVEHKLKPRLVCIHLNSTSFSCAVRSLCMKMINYRPWTKSEATALLIIFVWKENHTGELALCVYIHHEFI